MGFEVLETMEAPENSHIGIRFSTPKKVAGLMAQLKWIYTNAKYYEAQKLQCKQSQRNGGITCASGMLQQVAINYSESAEKDSPL